jgi:hypothetical protein
MKEPTGFGHFCAGILVLIIFLALAPSDLFAAEAEPAVSPAQEAELPIAEAQPATNSQEEVRLSQQAIDQLRREIEQSAARNTEAITSSLNLIEPTLTRLHERQMETVQSSNRTILIAAGIFAAVGLLGLMFVTVILVRAIGRFSELAVMTGSRGQMAGASLPALNSGEMAVAKPGAADLASGRFQGAIEQLQKRIMELEQSASLGMAESAVSSRGSGSRTGPPPPHQPTMAPALNIQPLLPSSPVSNTSPESASPPSRTSLLLGKGQALLNLDAAEPALQCFEEVLALEPGNAEAQVKKGMALEKLQDWEQALESYNRAIALDDSLTVAYLYRGGVCNRLQRYREALESYEQALRTEKRSRAS